MFPPTVREVQVIQMAVSCALGGSMKSLVEMVGQLEVEIDALPWWRLRDRRELRFQSNVVSRIATSMSDGQDKLASPSTGG